MRIYLRVLQKWAGLFPCIRYQVTISPTFYKQLFNAKVFFDAFLYLHFVFVIFWQKENLPKKLLVKMLVKLTTGDFTPQEEFEFEQG